LYINALDLAGFSVVHELGIRDLSLVLGLIELLKYSKEHQAHNEPHTDFLEHIAVQVHSFSGLIQELKQIAYLSI
jgi:hypothetical protein